ncbi:unnamed protein product [Caenorhabditis bovis]|uniref:F-box domain-containing protein n=1 Tax=Caenorhabditis bovis TaxID=2654633 RepID=A0A8S1FBT2_9PELO|nr:unnamed protein product [Caenorhabditis bovis]
MSLIDLSADVADKICEYLTQQEMSVLRGTCQTIKRYLDKSIFFKQSEISLQYVVYSHITGIFFTQCYVQTSVDSFLGFMNLFSIKEFEIVDCELDSSIITSELITGQARLEVFLVWPVRKKVLRSLNDALLRHWLTCDQLPRKFLLKNCRAGFSDIAKNHFMAELQRRLGPRSFRFIDILETRFEVFATAPIR